MYHPRRSDVQLFRCTIRGRNALDKAEPICIILDELIYNSLDVQSEGRTILTRRTDMYHPRQADIQLSRCTTSANAHP